MTTLCLRCKKLLHFVPGEGWRHPGGGLYMLRCPKCGAYTDQPVTACPVCGCTELRDDHAAQPKYGK